MAKNRNSFAIRSSRVRAKLRKRKNSLPRLTVFKSSSYVYAQLVDDSNGATLAVANTRQQEFKGLKSKYNVEAAKLVGTKLAERALEKGIKKAIFDKGGYQYHGKIKALADAFREAGVEV
jgi:large subunit ribosomal protein L18